MKCYHWWLSVTQSVYPAESLVQQLLKSTPTTMLGEKMSSGLLAGGHQESLRCRMLSLAGHFEGAWYMLPLFSLRRSASDHFQRWDTKLDRALIPLSITTPFSYPVCVQDPEEEPQKSNTRVLSCVCLGQAGSSPSTPSWQVCDSHLTHLWR